jgi:thiamine-phosphate pyrophosphorylase
MKIKGYYFITDAGLSKAGNLRDVSHAVAAGVSVVQYRNKTGTTRELYEEASRLREICQNTLLLINDRLDIALAVDADGVHLGQDDLSLAAARKHLGPDKIIGVTVHSLDQAIRAAGEGANYLGVSPIFPTTTKADAGPPAGLRLLRELKTKSHLSLVAIGGITLLNAPQVIASGAVGVCAISAVVSKDDVAREIIAFQGLFKV